MDARFFYCPRRNEIRVPKMPMNPNATINNPIGKRPTASASGKKVATANGGGGVKVGSRVGVTGATNAASRVGSSVGVETGVGVSGDCYSGRRPVLMIVT